MAVRNVNEKNFNETVLQASLPVVVEFGAAWCGYCRRLAPVITQLDRQYQGKLITVTMDIDECPVFAQQYQIDTIPTLLLFRDGQASAPLVNPGSIDVIREWLLDNDVAE